MPKQNINVALFDVRPKHDSGAVRVGKIVDLRVAGTPPKVLHESPTATPRISAIEQIARQGPIASHKEIIAEEIESALQNEHIVADLVRAGATIHAPTKQTLARIKDIPRDVPNNVPPQPPVRPPVPVRIPDTDDLPPVNLALSEESHAELKNFWTATPAHAPFEPRPHPPERTKPFGRAGRPVAMHALQVPPQHLSPVARDVEHWLTQVKARRNTASRKTFPRKAMLGVFIGILAIAGLTVAAFASSELVVQKEQQVLASGNKAVANLEEAKDNLKEFDFAGAADNFALAYDDFENASSTMNKFGASFLSVFGKLPGLGKVKSAQNLVQAGQQISKAGEMLSRAFSGLYKINFFAFFDPSGTTRNGQSLSEPIEEFQNALTTAQRDITSADKLLRDVRSDAIPEDKRVLFEEFRKQIPSFQAYIGQAVQYSDFLLSFVGKRGQKTYMVLLQNTSERRPTGGFPGTYAIISFDKGTLKKVFVDDIYNPDGQIKVNMIPPLPLQHITPNWGLRDANWFADFPTSARKIQEYYVYDGGASLDGVFAITPTVIARLLAIIGPIEMPEYGVTLDQNNFLAEMQDEVEYGDNRAQPKKIVVDFQPKFFAKLAEQQDKETWIEIIKVLFGALEEKHILAYFGDAELEDQAVKHGFAGELKKTDGDYLQVAFSNVKGAKADAVTANSMKLSVKEQAHTLTINRAHNGGDSKFAFYNRENASYVKVYVPKGSKFVSADGFSKPNYKPLVAHMDLGFKPDPDLASVESSMTQPVDGIDVFEESGKTVFGFWLNTKPRKVSTMSLVYTIPDHDEDGYDLLWQKQSGSNGDQMHVSVTLPSPLTVRGETEGIQIIGTTAVYDNDLSLDREVKIVFN